MVVVKKESANWRHFKASGVFFTGRIPLLRFAPLLTFRLESIDSELVTEIRCFTPSFIPLVQLPFRPLVTLFSKTTALAPDFYASLLSDEVAASTASLICIHQSSGTVSRRWFHLFGCLPVYRLLVCLFHYQIADALVSLVCLYLGYCILYAGHTIRVPVEHSY